MFFHKLYADHRDLHSFPTRRSSDLPFRSRLPGSRASGARSRSASSRKRAPPKAPRPAPPRRWVPSRGNPPGRSEEHTSELQSRRDLVCRLLLEKKKNKILLENVRVI